ncbi:rod shape-determining protein MreC [Desulfococcaceae bacterium HSG7]|nr:rod shape-determining protein MreC [Desulfococcaceae bacterium HSG9]MDM8556000.1 rod shape-determining protein MreC [Desulfococcaceae bacterium HSG7]
MFSRKGVILICVIVLVALNIMVIAFIGQNYHPTGGPGPVGIYLIAPFQKIATNIISFAKDVWRHYFFIAAAAKENDLLKKELHEALKKNQQYIEMELVNKRLRALLNFKKEVNRNVVTAEVIGKDPSRWYKTVIIDKGTKDKIVKGSAVVAPLGVAGQVIETLPHYSKVQLMTDRNSSVDAVVQKQGARGIVKGDGGNQCSFEYVLRKHHIKVGDVIVTTGLDGVFPKGQRVGHVFGIVEHGAGNFKELIITPYVDFENINELMVLLNPIPRNIFNSFRDNP